MKSSRENVIIVVIIETRQKRMGIKMDWIFWFFLICIIVGILWGLIEAKVKGVIGEAKVAMILSSLPNTEYRVLNDVMLPTDKGSTQIDHVVVSIYGIFVIETKNYSGWITGKTSSEQWTKNMYGKKYFFYNPLRQNYGHIKTLEKVLDFPEEYFISIVAFSRKAKLKIHTYEHVIYYHQLKKTMQSYQKIVIPENEIDGIANKLVHINEQSKELRGGHKKRVHEIQLERKKEKSDICPRCSGKLIKRRGRYGNFWGCNNYPKCKYTKK